MDELHNDYMDDERRQEIVARPHPQPCEECQVMLADFPDTLTLPITLDDGTGWPVCAYIWPCGAVSFGNAYAHVRLRRYSGPFARKLRARGFALSN
jgi:hypothetical protein